MTRTERLAQAAARAQDHLTAQKKRLAQIEAQQRDEARKILARRCHTVGQLAAQVGLLTWDDGTLRAVFAALAVLLPCPDPVAVLAGLLSDPAREEQTRCNTEPTHASDYRG